MINITTTNKNISTISKQNLVPSVSMYSCINDFLIIQDICFSYVFISYVFMIYVFCVGVMYSGCHVLTYIYWASISKVVGSIPTVARHIFQACPVWIYAQSNIANIMFLTVIPLRNSKLKNYIYP